MPNQAKKIEQLLAKYFAKRISDRGYTYFVNDFIREISIEEGKTVQATVSGSESYNVHLDLINFPKSECSCPYDNYCKHMAAVLYYVKDVLMTEDIELIDVKEIQHSIQEELETTVVQVYKILTSSRYLTDAQLKQLSDKTLHSIKQTAEFSYKKTMIGVFYLVNGTLSLAQKFKTSDPFERRFMKFYQYIVTYIEPLLPQVSEESDSRFKEWLSDSLLFYYIDYLEVDHSPWETLLREWIMLEENRNKTQDYYKILSENHKHNKENRSLTYLTSLVALACEDGARSLQLLRVRSNEVTPNDLYYHFKLLQDRNDRDTMKVWFNLFIPSWKNQSLGRLQPFYEQMALNSQDINSQIQAIWKSWLTRPSFQTYQTKIKSYNKDDRKKVLSYILPLLERHHETPFTQQLYIQIVNKEQLYEEGIDFLLKHEKNPLQLSPEKERFLKGVKQHNSAQLLPIYHQFVVRLVEKKSRQHYEEAVEYLIELGHIYNELGKQDRFSDYLEQLKSTYKTYRALLQEMKKLNGIVKGK